ncbi:hypothetical protein [Microbacterium aerolatum]|uniref:YdhG-like domain-containing protein n=1 Tax=Microbacterium aerolatum TaxID=153731 RepID=A0A511AI81_9MICO|nr:hypothetical protein [Microbacterium aerolatum]MCK3769352.1 hypothetical protein [Microbacterium aerolatum]GEK86431.1 hypothetical protein MAE01_16070 [Microbacterium aerolatum]GGB22785.1 hypothetical protein GCM10007198_11580 [Microbacterium aerolatum]
MSEKNFTAEERDAMKAKLAESKTTKSRAKKSPEEARAEGTAEIKAKIADMPDEDRMLGEKVFAMVAETAPHLMPRTYYGMPAWANDAGKVVCFFKPKSKFKVRYATFEFEAPANLDDGNVWPTAYAVTALTDADLTFLAERVRQAAN